MGADSIKPIGSANDVQMVNRDAYQGVQDQLQAFMQNPMSGNPYSGRAESALNQMQGLSGNYNNFIAQLFGSGGNGGLAAQLSQATKGYDPQAGYNLFMQNQPGLSGMTENMANRALSQQGDTARSLAQRTAQQSLGSVAGQLAEAGLLGSGAGVGAMTEAALTPTLAAENQLAQARAGYLGNLDTQLTSQLMGQSQSAYDAQRNQLIQGILGQAGFAESGANMLGSRIGALGNVSSGYGNLANLFSSSQANALGNLAQLNAPEYWQPQYQTDKSDLDWGKALAGAGTGALTGAAMGAPVGGIGALPASLIGGGLGFLGGLFG